MTEVHKAVTASTSFRHGSDRGMLTAAEVLRHFDQTRRQIALQVAGTEGAGAGYDSLWVDWPCVAAVGIDDVVTITGLLTGAHDRGHRVDYVATSTTRGGRCVVLAQAHGWTLTPPRSRLRQPTHVRSRGDVDA